MSIAASSSILKVRGSLILSPTNLGIPEPFGGTYLGMARDQQFMPQTRYRKVRSEASGATKDLIYCGEDPVFKAVLRYPDIDAILNIAPKAISSGSSGVRWLFRPEGVTSNTRAGTSMAASSIKLLFAPRATVAHPMVLFYNAVATIDSAAMVPWGFNEEWALAVTFYATPDSSGRCYDTGQRANLVL